MTVAAGTYFNTALDSVKGMNPVVVAAKSKRAVPGLSLPANLPIFQAAWFRDFDARAIELGQRIKAEHPTPAALYARADEYEKKGWYWLAGQNRQLAADLARDPRLAAIVPLVAASYGDGGFGKAWAPEYRRLVLKQIGAKDE